MLRRFRRSMPQRAAVCRKMHASSHVYKENATQNSRCLKRSLAVIIVYCLLRTTDHTRVNSEHDIGKGPSQYFTGELGNPHLNLCSLLYGQAVTRSRFNNARKTFGEQFLWTAWNSLQENVRHVTDALMKSDSE